MSKLVARDSLFANSTYRSMCANDEEEVNAIEPGPCVLRLAVSKQKCSNYLNKTFKEDQATRPVGP